MSIAVLGASCGASRIRVGLTRSIGRLRRGGLVALGGGDDGDVEVGRAELVQDGSEQCEVVLLPVSVGDAAEVEQALAGQPRSLSKPDTTSFAPVSSPERNSVVGAGSVVGSATTTAATLLAALTTLRCGKASWMRRPRLSSGIASEKSGLAALAMSQSTVSPRLSAPIDVSRGSVSTPCTALSTTSAPTTASAEAATGAGSPAAVCRVVRADDALVTGAHEAGGEGLGRRGRFRGWRFS